MEAIPIVLFWSIALWAIYRPQHVLIYCLFASMPFGSFAVIPTTMTAGLTLTPAPVVALLLIGKELGNEKGMSYALNQAFSFSRLGYIFLFWIVAGITTAFMPQFFAGQIVIVPIRSEILMETAMLRPSPQNISQFVYISVSVLAVFAFSRNLTSFKMRQHVLKAVLLGAFVTVITGLLDFASQYLPMDQVLDIFRTASYALLTSDEILGGKRVVGLMPEASAFGNLALTFLTALYFFRRTMVEGFLKSWLVPSLMLSLLILVWKSTSSAAYLGLGVFGLTALVEWFHRALTTSTNRYKKDGLVGEFYVGAVFLVLTGFLFLSVPNIFAPIQELLDMMIFQKSTSSSFEERSMWTKVSWEALLASGGWGVGLGGTRASNSAVAIFSSTGLLGGICYLIFVIQFLFTRGVKKLDFEGEALMSAIRYCFVPSFIATLTIGTTPDFGLFNAFLFGFCVTLSNKKLRRGMCNGVNEPVSGIVICKKVSLTSEFGRVRNAPSNQH